MSTDMISLDEVPAVSLRTSVQVMLDTTLGGAIHVRKHRSVYL